jgi:ankyrin repeat protein
VQYGRISTALLLVKAGADLDAKDAFGLTPLDYANNVLRQDIEDAIPREASKSLKLLRQRLRATRDGPRGLL